MATHESSNPTSRLTVDDLAHLRAEVRIELDRAPRQLTYYGTRQQLLDEGILSAECTFPGRGSRARRWTAGHFSYWLERRRPKGYGRGPWADLDYWMLWIIDDRYTNDDTDEHQRRLCERARAPVCVVPEGAATYFQTNTDWIDPKGTVRASFRDMTREMRQETLQHLFKTMPRMQSDWYTAMRNLVAEVDDEQGMQEHGAAAKRIAQQVIARVSR